MKLRASDATAIISAAKKNAVGSSATPVSATALQGIAAARPAALSAGPKPRSTVSPIEAMLRSPVVSAMVATARNLPATTSTRAAGATKSVSRVPRSFSPAVRSMAG